MRDQIFKSFNHTGGGDYAVQIKLDCAERLLPRIILME